MVRGLVVRPGAGIHSMLPLPVVRRGSSNGFPSKSETPETKDPHTHRFGLRAWTGLANKYSVVISTEAWMTVSALDINCHFLPHAYLAAVRKSGVAIPHMLERASAFPLMTEVSVRLDAISSAGDVRQLPSLASPPLEQYAPPDLSP